MLGVLRVDCEDGVRSNAYVEFVVVKLNIAVQNKAGSVRPCITLRGDEKKLSAMSRRCHEQVLNVYWDRVGEGGYVWK